MPDAATTDQWVYGQPGFLLLYRSSVQADRVRIFDRCAPASPDPERTCYNFRPSRRLVRACSCNLSFNWEGRTAGPSVWRARRPRPTEFFWKLTQTVGLRQGRDAVLQRYPPVADPDGFVRAAARFPCGQCALAEDRFCSPPLYQRDQASRSFAIATGFRNLDSSPARLNRRFHFSEM